MSSHVFLPVYLDANKKVLDNSTNAVETLDASFNFLMNTTYCTAANISNFLKYKKNNNNYTFKFNESYKILTENNMKNDISGSSIELYNSNFYSGIDSGKACIGRMFVRYIADVLMGHPFNQAFIANESKIIDDVNNSNLHKQLTTFLSDGLTTTSFNNNNICLSLINQYLEQSPERFNNTTDDTEYNFPFQGGDFITLFIKMKSIISLEKRSVETQLSSYDLLKRIFQNKNHITFDDSNNQLNIDQSIWRIKIELQ